MVLIVVLTAQGKNVVNVCVSSVRQHTCSAEHVGDDMGKRLFFFISTRDERIILAAPLFTQWPHKTEEHSSTCGIICC